MSALDLHVLPSLGEAFPNVVAEAMACGTPCVVTDVGDAPIIVGKAGWVVPPGTPVALADAIVTALEMRKDIGKWNMLRNDVREHVVANFGIETMISRYNFVWEEVVRRSF
jgi:glycosyltransferase involved in cell wall biosynthesis